VRVELLLLIENVVSIVDVSLKVRDGEAVESGVVGTGVALSGIKLLVDVVMTFAIGSV
jgi:hypothetical protein